MYSTALLEKLVFLEDAVTKKSELTHYPIPINLPLVDLNPLFNAHIKNYDRKMFQIYSPQVDDYIPLSMISIQPFIIPICYFALPTVLIKYFYLQEPEISQPNPEESIGFFQSTILDKKLSIIQEDPQETLKKQRSRERSIMQAIELVREWRTLQTKLIQGKRLSLKETADEIGVSKKSLDDYFYQLRVGQFYNFDFEAHREKKIGFLRSFVKKKQSENKGKVNSQKMPKKLKVIDNFDSFFSKKNSRMEKENPKSGNGKIVDEIQKQEHPNQEKSPEESAKKQTKNSEVEELAPQQEAKQKNIFSDQGFFWGNPFDSVSQDVMSDCQKNFFNGFRSNIPDDDPFIGYSLQRQRSQDENSFNSFHLF